MIAKKIPFFAFDDNWMIYQDGSLGAGFRLQGVDISISSPDQINSVCQKLEHFLVGLPENIKLQVFYRMKETAQNIIESHQDISSSSDEYYEPIRQARLKYLTEKEKNGEYYTPEIYFFVRTAPNIIRKRKLFQKEKDFEVKLEKDFNELKERFGILTSQIESGLRSIQLDPSVLTTREWFNLSFLYYNYSRYQKIGIPTLRNPLAALAPSLAEQLALSEMSVSKTSLNANNLKYRVVSMGLLPEGRSYASLIENLTKLPFHFWISQNIKTLTQRKVVDALEVKRRIANSMAAGSSNVSDLESESSLSSIEDLLREVMAGTEKLISSDMNVIIWGNSTEELERNSEEVLRAFRSMNQAEGLVENFALEDAFFSAAPGVCEGFRHRKMKTSNCAHLMPVYTAWPGNARPVVLLTNRESMPFSVDPFAKELPNWNGLVFGGSGSGKSFSIGQLMLQFFGQTPKPKIVWIDNGASSEKLIEVLNGEFIDLNLDSGIRLNMFDLDPGETKPTSSKIKLILGCLELILKDENQVGLPKREKAILEESIFKTYELVKGRTPTLSDLKQILSEHKFQEMQKYADILFSWTGNTAYGKMLDGESNVKLTKDLVTIEIKGLDNYHELKDIFLLLLTSYIKSEAASDLARPYLLLIDEAHRLFKGSKMGKEFAVDCFRVFRKYNAGIWCISQNYKDFLSDTDLADSLMPNTSFVFILRQRKIDWNDFKETFDFNNTQVEAAQSLEIVKGKYSELLFLQDENMSILRLEPEPLSYWICTSDGNDKGKVSELRQKHPDLPLIEILKRLSSEDYHATA